MTEFACAGFMLKNPGMANKARRKPAPEPEEAEMDPVLLFRHWLAARITGRHIPSIPASAAELPEPFRILRSEAAVFYSDLARKGAEILEKELSRVFSIFFRELDDLSLVFDVMERQGNAPKESAGFLEGLDAALEGLHLRFSLLMEMRAVGGRNPWLIYQESLANAGNPKRAEFLLHRLFEVEPEPEDPAVTRGGIIAQLIQTACDAAEVLERLEQKYPEAVQWEAQFRDRWPVLRRKRDRALQFSPARVTLGSKYPLDADAVVHDARKDSLRAYLTPRVIWLSYARNLRAGDRSSQIAEAEDAMQRRGHPWHLRYGPRRPEAAAMLVDTRDLPPLRKSTAREWADRLVVPFIMATDAVPANEYELNPLTEPALQAIWSHIRVKSVKSFRSRLLDAVRKELPRMARK